VSSPHPPRLLVCTTNNTTSFLGITFGDHVGDWEHQTVRFVNGVPTAVWLSAHSDGDAYTYAALPKQGVRPVTYIAVGDHANYATAGKQPYPVPVIGPIADNTGAGAFWDVTLNYRGFWYNNATNTFTSAGGAGTGGTEQATEGVSWLNFLGAWGDDTPPTQFLKSEQYCISTECHYTAGPSGTSICLGSPCAAFSHFSQDPSRRTLVARLCARMSRVALSTPLRR
jgi:hypothetical protein